MRTNISYTKILRKMMWFMALLLVVVTAGCDRMHEEATGAIVAAGPPTVASVVPIDIATGVCINKNVTATFNKAMLASSITMPGTFTVKETVTSNDAPGLVTYDATTMTATFTPTANFTPSLGYTATITTAATDSAGNALAVAKVWSFTAGVTTCAAPINLGILSPFGIASFGGITDAGATKINGNVVVHPTYNCNAVPILFADGPGFGVCGGNIANIPTHNVGDLVITSVYPDTTTAPAVMAALSAKWNSISPALLPGATVLGCGTIGNAGGAGVGIGCAGNSTLPPGVYISATASTIDVTGDITLDGQGDPNAVFVFQAPTALTMSVNSRILLTNSAKASNVWWYVGSSAVLNGGTVFEGNILASASISMGTGATSCGRLLAGAAGSGAFTFLANTVSVPGHPNAPAGCQ